MTAADRLRQIATAIPSDDSAVTLTRADLLALIEGEGTAPVARDMTVEQVAEEVQRSVSTVVTFRASDREMRAYKAAARSLGVSRSEFIRAACRAAIETVAHSTRVKELVAANREFRRARSVRSRRRRAPRRWWSLVIEAIQRVLPLTKNTTRSTVR